MNVLGIVLFAVMMTSCVQTQEKNVCDTVEELDAENLVTDTVECAVEETVVEEIDVSADQISMEANQLNGFAGKYFFNLNEMCDDFEWIEVMPNGRIYFYEKKQGETITYDRGTINIISNHAFALPSGERGYLRIPYGTIVYNNLNGVEHQEKISHGEIWSGIVFDVAEGRAYLPSEVLMRTPIEEYNDRNRKVVNFFKFHRK